MDGAAALERVTVPAVVEAIEDVYRMMRGDLSPDKVRRIAVDDALVDTGATGLSLPARFIRQLGLFPMVTRRALTTTGIRDVKTFGAVRLTVNGRECVCDVTEISDDCPVLIGQVPLELMDFVVDPGRRQLITNPAHGGEQLIELL
jgi:predicted aspartyl protease